MKLLSPAERPVRQHNPSAHVKQKRVLAKLEYLSLKCGHVTTSDVGVLYAAFQVKPDTYFCETCGEWSETGELTALPAQPDEPPF